MANSTKDGKPAGGGEDWRSTVLRRELARHACGLEWLAAKLEEAGDYPTETAVTFCRIIRLTARLIGSRLDSAPVGKLPYIFTIMRNMGQYLRFVERSRIEQTPWSMIQATEVFLKQHTPKECCFILRPQWAYNYSIKSGFVETLRAYFDSLPEWMPLSEWEQAVGEAAKCRVYCISFPRVERMNVLMHVNWGHEVGHIVASEWLNTELNGRTKFDVLWAKSKTGIERQIRANYESVNRSPQEELLKSFYREQYVAATMKEVQELTQSGFKELISDFIGAHLLGPAALACLGEFSTRYELDANPCDCGRYPPWRMRLRKIAEVVGEDLAENDCCPSGSEHHALVAPYLRFLGKVQLLGSAKSDLPAIESDIRTREAYKVSGLAN